MLVCGIALFLYGMEQGEQNLKNLGGDRLRQIISAITKNRFAGYLTGFITTIMTQSSSATTVMLVGLASVQLMTLRQSLGVILGSDLGTTVTVQLFAFKFYLLAPLLIAFGFTVSYLKKTGPVSLAGRLLLATGFVFFGMYFMADASGTLQNQAFIGTLVAESFSNPWIGIAAGIALTTIMQSSAATLAIVIALAQHYTFADHSTPGPGHFLPIVLGANIGTCSTAFLAILQAETEGIRVAWAHLSFKIIGTFLALPFIWILHATAIMATWPAALQIATLHTLFNLFLAIVFLPLVPLFSRAIKILIKRRKEISLRFKTYFLHEKVLPFPVLALSQSIKEISRIAGIVMKMVEECMEVVNRFDYLRKRRIIDNDDEVDFLHEKIMAFLTRIARKELGSEEAKRASMLLLVTTDLEHIGDIVSKNILQLAEKIDRSPVPLSSEGRQEIMDFFRTAAQLLREALNAFTSSDWETAKKVSDRRSEIKTGYDSCVEFHMNRLYNRRVESLQTTSIHIDLLEEINRITHFSFRIVNHIMGTH